MFAAYDTPCEPAGRTDKVRAYEREQERGGGRCSLPSSPKPAKKILPHRHFWTTSDKSAPMPSHAKDDPRTHAYTKRSRMFSVRTRSTVPAKGEDGFDADTFRSSARPAFRTKARTQAYGICIIPRKYG